MEYIGETPIVKVKTLSAKMVKQIRTPGLAEQRYKDLVQMVTDGLKSLGWINGSTLDNRTAYWHMLLMDTPDGLFWLLWDVSKPLPTSTPQLFIT